MPRSHPQTTSSAAGRYVILFASAILFILVAFLATRPPPVSFAPPDPDLPPPILVPDFSIALGHIRPPLPYRIVSFHRGRADKNLIKLAAQLGFNGVQFQIEGSNEKGVQDFADRDAKEHLVDYCHSLGLNVTAWVHELSDLPSRWSDDYLGPVSADNEKLFAFLDDRYERMLTKTLPNIDGLVLTVVETQVRATDSLVMLRLANLLSQKCRQHHKSLIVRTFVWYPEEFYSVMAAIRRLPPDTVIMSKVVPQDWQMKGANAPEIGAVGGRPQIVELDACGEYFLKDTVANCMVDLLKRQFDEGVSKNIQGICVRVDRDDSSVLFSPNEVNLWALGLLAAGAADNADDIWSRWASYRYGAAAAPQIIRTLRPTAEVVSEIVSVGPFTFGDTRRFPPLPDDEDIFLTNWQNWRWDASYLPAFQQAQRGDAAFISDVAAQKNAAMKSADACLQNLEVARSRLAPVEYEILHAKLLTNKTQLAAYTAMELAALEFRAMQNASSAPEWMTRQREIRNNIKQVRAVAAGITGEAREVEYMGKRWQIGAAEVSREQLVEWADEADEVLAGNHEANAKIKNAVR